MKIEKSKQHSNFFIFYNNINKLTSNQYILPSKINL